MKQGVENWEQGSIPKLVLWLSFPTVVSMVATSLGQLADALFASQLGVTQAAAVGLTLPYLSLLQSMGYTVALGGGTCVARLLGEKKEEQAAQTASTAFWLSVAVGGAATSVTWMLTPFLVEWVGADTILAPYVAVYLKTAAGSLPFYAGSYTLCGLMRAYGAPFRALAGTLAGSVAGLVVSPWLMFEHNMGLAGAGLGAVVGQLTVLVVLCVGFRGKTMPSIFCFHKTTLRVKPCLMIAKNGISSLVRQGAAAVAGVAVNRTAVKYGAGTVAALAAACKVTGVLYSAFLGLGQGFLPLAGFYYGGNSYLDSSVLFGLLFGPAV